MPQRTYHQATYYPKHTLKKNTNILKFQIPGLQKPINIPFPARKLPVCERCKKNYKTRELCRVRDGHTDLPWNTTYLCVSLDESCLTRNSNGELSIVEEGPGKYQFIAKSIDSKTIPYRYISKKNHLGGSKAPICTSCKEKNYTRQHCREKQGHLQLPWGTAYVRLYAVPCSSQLDNAYFQEDVSIGTKRSHPSSPSSSIGTEGSVPKKRKCDDLENDKNNAGNDDIIVESDDIHKVEASKAFYLTIKKDGSTLRWLEVDPCRERMDYENQCSNPYMEQYEQIQHRPHHYQRHHGQYCPPVSIPSPPPPPRGWSGFSSCNLVKESDCQVHHQYWNEGNPQRQQMLPCNSGPSYQPNPRFDTTQPSYRRQLDRMPYKNGYALHSTSPQSTICGSYDENGYQEAFNDESNHHHPQHQKESWVQRYGGYSREPARNQENVRGGYSSGMYPQHDKRVSNGGYCSSRNGGAMYPSDHQQYSSSTQWKRSNNYHD